MALLALSTYLLSCQFFIFYFMGKKGNFIVFPFFFGGTILTSMQPVISGYQNITFDNSIITLCNT